MTDDLSAEGRAEHELRDLFRQSVAAVEPDPAGLTRLRAAVPRRRARHRYTWTGAAAVLLAVAAVPALHAVQPFPFSGGPAASGADAYHGAATAAGTLLGTPEGPHSSRHPAQPGSTGGAVPTAGPSADTGPSAGPSAPAVTVPDCVRADLGRADAHVEAADAAGNVYGFFTVRNTSARRCGLTGAGTVVVTAANGADPARVKVADHTAGDPATALPAPTAQPGPLVLGPGEGYRVRFGWVPEGTCPSSPSDVKAGPSLAAGAGQASADPAPVAAADPSSGPSPSASPSAAPPAVTVAHTPQAGGPAAASTVISGSCGGTVYRSAPEAVPVEPASATPAAG
ncbi:hypothetical protein [Kitasatospora sp. NPDC059571]|uniref:hypothetical protein n=1 Tax=Kitasatospora sp. NPDC059571 TaxID=3346871 RepID=UPI0036CF774F